MILMYILFEEVGVNVIVLLVVCFMVLLDVFLVLV